MAQHAAPDGATATEAFFECVKAVSNPEITQQMMPNLKRRFQNPPTGVISTALSQHITDEQVRRILFFPGPSDMAVYPTLLAGDPDCPSDLTGSAANKAQAVALGHMYLVHGRSWERMRPFIEAGGLQSLVKLLRHPNNLIASQSLQILLLATHPDMYDWHNPPAFANSSSSDSHNSNHTCPASCSSSDHQHKSTDHAVCAAYHGSGSCTNTGRNQAKQQRGPHLQQLVDSSSATSSTTPTAVPTKHPSQGPDGVAWQQLVQLHQGPLLHSLLQLSPDLWPGSGYQALQLLAFYLSWLRAWWSQGGVLQLSAALLSGITAWSKRSTICPEERELAAALAKDFSKAGPAGAPAGGVFGGAGLVTSSDIGVEFGPTAELRVTADRTQINSGPGSEAARLKAAGNDAFKAKDWATAIRLYSAALDVPVPAAALIDEAPRRAVYHTNRAAAYLERVWELQAAAAGSSCSNSSSSWWREVGGLLDGQVLDGSDESIAKQLESAVMDCKAAIDLVPTHTKAHYRLSTALRAQGKLSQALVATAAAEQHASSAADKAAAARLAAAIKQQQQQPPGADSSKLLSSETAAVTASRGMDNSNTGRSSCINRAASTCKAAAAAAPDGDPLGQLLQQFAAAVCKDGGSAVTSTEQRLGSKQSGKDTSAMLDIKTPAQAAADEAASRSNTAEVKLPQPASTSKPPAGEVLVQVLTSSEGEPGDNAPADAMSGHSASCGVNRYFSTNKGDFLMQEVQTSRLC